MRRQSVAIIDHGDDPDALQALLERARHAACGIISRHGCTHTAIDPAIACPVRVIAENRKCVSSSVDAKERACLEPSAEILQRSLREMREAP
ncbi:MAG: hypothetical protein PHQ14_10185 [Chromatiales bacterium]|jgi:hypothetical protein|nr:hypothetical protein [Chromatiales bacterium]MDX9766790.1 hypothetical protein [Ectothiorhodospiraceae bacterium]